MERNYYLEGLAIEPNHIGINEYLVSYMLLQIELNLQKKD